MPLIVIAGAEYGTGSSRDWAAKGTLLLGVRAVIAKSFERIHRSNLVGMGVLPLEFADGASASSLGLTGRELYDLEGLANLRPRQTLTVRARGEGGAEKTFRATVRIDTPRELDYYRHGGILPYVLRQLRRELDCPLGHGASRPSPNGVRRAVTPARGVPSLSAAAGPIHVTRNRGSSLRGPSACGGLSLGIRPESALGVRDRVARAPRGGRAAAARDGEARRRRRARR